MSKLIDMKRSKTERKQDSPCSISESEDYPYGLRITLDDTSLKKLGVTDLPEVGKDISLAVSGKVTSVSSNENQNRKDRRVEIQLQRISIEDGSESKDKIGDAIYERYKELKGRKSA